MGRRVKHRRSTRQTNANFNRDLRNAIDRNLHKISGNSTNFNFNLLTKSLRNNPFINRTIAPNKTAVIPSSIGNPTHLLTARSTNSGWTRSNAEIRDTSGYRPCIRSNTGTYQVYTPRSNGIY